MTNLIKAHFQYIKISHDSESWMKDTNKDSDLFIYFLQLCTPLMTRIHALFYYQLKEG